MSQRGGGAIFYKAGTKHSKRQIVGYMPGLLIVQTAESTLVASPDTKSFYMDGYLDGLKDADQPKVDVAD